MEALLDIIAFALPVVFLLGVSRMERTARQPERVERELTQEERRRLTPWDVALMKGQLLNGDPLVAGHRLKLECGGQAVWDGEQWLHDSTKQPMKLIASGNLYRRGDSMEYL